MKFGRCLGSTAVEAPAKFQSDTGILTPHLTPWRLCEILQWDLLCNIESVPCMYVVIVSIRLTNETKSVIFLSTKGSNSFCQGLYILLVTITYNDADHDSQFLWSPRGQAIVTHFLHGREIFTGVASKYLLPYLCQHDFFFSTAKPTKHRQNTGNNVVTCGLCVAWQLALVTVLIVFLM